MAFKLGMTAYIAWHGIMFMLVSMTLILMQGDSRLAKANNQHCRELFEQLSKQ